MKSLHVIIVYFLYEFVLMQIENNNLFNIIIHQNVYVKLPTYIMFVLMHTLSEQNSSLTAFVTVADCYIVH